MVQHTAICAAYLPYTEQRAESRAIHLKIKGSKQARVVTLCALCENTTEMQAEKRVLVKHCFLEMIPLRLAL